MVIAQNLTDFIVGGHLDCRFEGPLHPEVEVAKEEHVVIEANALETGMTSPKRAGEFLITLNTFFNPGGFGIEVAVDEEETGVEEPESDTDSSLVGNDVRDAGGFAGLLLVGDEREQGNADEDQETHLELGK